MNRIAVVGAGISGLAAAWRLQHRAQVTLFEADARLGGHTDSHSIHVDGRTYTVDSGFIVFNPVNYPRLCEWFGELGVDSQESDMSFAVSNAITGFEYGTRNVAGLLCRRGNLLSPKFWTMLRDLRRFYRDAGAVCDGDPRTLAEFAAERRYGASFVDNHLAPMCAALWSLPQDDALALPVAHVVAFMAHHRMLQINGRPQWRVVRGGSCAYLRAFRQRFAGRIRSAEPVLGVVRDGGIVRLRTPRGEETFDGVVLACHADQALAMLTDPSPQERDILGSFRYSHNRVVVHSDPRVMPQARAAWSSWNALVNEARGDACQVSYWMNCLQSLGSEQDFFVTLNPTTELDSVWCERRYAHPQFDVAARRAQGRRHEIDGAAQTWYAGAYWGWGFHEDGFVSGEAAAEAVLARPERRVA